MSTTDQIYLATGLPPADVARRLAESLDLTVREDELGVVVYQRREVDGVVHEFGGPLERNLKAPAPEDASVTDGYDTQWDVHLHPQDEDELHRRARAAFDVVTGRLGWPGVLVLDVDVLAAARRAGEAVVEFPAGTTPFLPGRAVWEPYALTGKG